MVNFTVSVSTARSKRCGTDQPIDDKGSETQHQRGVSEDDEYVTDRVEEGRLPAQFAAIAAAIDCMPTGESDETMIRLGEIKHETVGKLLKHGDIEKAWAGKILAWLIGQGRQKLMQTLEVRTDDKAPISAHFWCNLKCGFLQDSPTTTKCAAVVVARASAGVTDERVGRALAFAGAKLGAGTGAVIAALSPKRAAAALGSMGHTLATTAMNQMEAAKVKDQMKELKEDPSFKTDAKANPPFKNEGKANPLRAEGGDAKAKNPSFISKNDGKTSPFHLEEKEDIDNFADNLAYMDVEHLADVVSQLDPEDTAAVVQR
eukprot:1194636-Prorocentrum_minimum.AAC.4